jgi:heat-inducible transcriptional repressor
VVAAWTKSLQIGSTDDPDKILASASRQLSEVTSMAGVVMLPRREQVSLRQVEFLPLSHNRVLVILVLNEREVQNRIIQTQRELQCRRVAADRQLPQSACVPASDLRRVRQHRAEGNGRYPLQHESADGRCHCQMAQQAFQPRTRRMMDLLLAGQTNLMSYEEMSNLDKLRKLFEAFNRKRDILQLLDQSSARRWGADLHW